MELKNIDNIHLGNKISELVKKRNVSVYGVLSGLINKTPAGIYKDFEKPDLSFKQVYTYLKHVNVDLCDFARQIGLCEEKENISKANDIDFEYKVNKNDGYEALKKEIELLNKLLDEKERMIQFLSKKQS